MISHSVWPTRRGGSSFICNYICMYWKQRRDNWHSELNSVCVCSLIVWSDLLCYSQVRLLYAGVNEHHFPFENDTERERVLPPDLLTSFLSNAFHMLKGLTNQITTQGNVHGWWECYIPIHNFQGILQIKHTLHSHQVQVKLTRNFTKYLLQFHGRYMVKPRFTQQFCGVIETFVFLLMFARSCSCMIVLDVRSKMCYQ